MYASLSYSYWLTLALAPLAAGFQIRTFIIMHDCAHGSFLPSRRANEVVGFLTGVLTLTAFAQWRRDHALHHASSGDLDRRGHGDILTLTVDEYLEKSLWGRLRYRAYRHPLVLFGLGPLYLFLLNRWHTAGSGAKAGHIWGVHATNGAIALLALVFVKTLGAGPVLLIYTPVYLLSAAAGIWLFYVQHQFEGTYWRPHEEWDYATAGLRGSSYYRLPRVLEWVTGCIGLHHVHHIDPKIPNYHLRRCHDSTSEFRAVPELTLGASLRSVSLKLWDADRGRLVGFDALRSARLRAKRAPVSATMS
jgi:omega-6 fatty acid desaturase (delta-12 desaturase)